MKVFALERTDLKACVEKMQSEHFIMTCNGRPLALVVGVVGLDREQVELGASDKFWEFITESRKGKTITRAELDEELKRLDAEKRRKRKPALNGRRATKIAAKRG